MFLVVHSLHSSRPQACARAIKSAAGNKESRYLPLLDTSAEELQYLTSHPRIAKRRMFTTQQLVSKESENARQRLTNVIDAIIVGCEYSVVEFERIIST